MKKIGVHSGDILEIEGTRCSDEMPVILDCDIPIPKWLKKLLRRT